ncbi:MAG TPA: glycosyltransferase family 9 protein [Opitutaceae bacterium]|nr:glycosyltransferase family 9 protein [Opitutaceae bacterium]
MTELLIIKPSSLGDIVHGLQVAASLKAQRSELRIAWIVRDLFESLVRTCEVVDRVYVFHRAEGVRGFLKLMREVRQTHYDYVFDMQGLLRTGLMTWRARAAKKVGRCDAREGATFFYSKKVPLPPAGAQSHALDVLLQFCPVLDAQPELRGELRFREAADLNLGFIDGPRGQKPILIFPDSRRVEKRWNGFRQLTDLLLRDGSGRKVVWAGNNPVVYRDNAPDGQFVNLTGNTSLVSLPALVRRAEWVISNDSGPMHLAAALGVKTLGLFGPTDPRLFGPYPPSSPTNHVVHAPVGDLRLLTARDVYARFARLDAISRGQSPPGSAAPWPRRPWS